VTPHPQKLLNGGRQENPLYNPFLYDKEAEGSSVHLMLRKSAALLVAAAAADAFAGTNGFMLAPSGIVSPIVCTTVSADNISFCI